MASPAGRGPGQPASPERFDRTVVVLLGLAAVLFVAIRLPALSLPLERDEGEYAYIAWRWLEGDVPYRDAFDQKPPGAFAFYALAVGALGGSVEAIHLLTGVWTAATAVLLFAVLRRVGDPLAAAFGVLLFALLSGDPRLIATAANTELLMLLPAVASVWVVTRPRGTTSGGAFPGVWLAGGRPTPDTRRPSAASGRDDVSSHSDSARRESGRRRPSVPAWPGS